MNDSRTLQGKPLTTLPASSRGFGFIEIAITTVILGIAFAMTIKGTALVQTFRGQVTLNKIQQFQNAAMVYQNDRGYLPGDDPAAPRHFGRDEAVIFYLSAPLSTAGDRKLDGKLFDTLNPNGEAFMAWRDLRYAGLVDGDPAVAGASAMPENLFGGIYGFDEGNLGQQAGSLCLTRIPGRAAAMIDKRLDDGVINKGKIVATSKYDAAEALNHFDAPDSEPYNFEKEYIICAPILP